ncbi:MAG TPA: hypothetical protein PLE76_06675 [Rectinema sp.]|jgi:hypothetical protein|nr:hypothetical protein [Spirochaetia bacterium]MDI9427670.1 hypothetical protein [Spirochaetota bacterium]NLH90429.1 hypothetical protein [Treponema sp.]OQC74352.1 MAG: hypothetical protein BWX44_01025 [Spirochaetes bacterium ADurb.Bin001]HNP93450.1 hypothetical protein [Rectinema sp.]
MSSAERNKIDLRADLKDTAMRKAPAFPDFAQVYKKAEEQPRKRQKILISTAIAITALVASFFVGGLWESRSSADVALIDSWSVTPAPIAIGISALEDEDDQIILTSSKNSTLNLYIQGLWESTSTNGL